MTVDFTTALKDFFDFHQIRDNELKYYMLAQVFEDINYHGVARFFYDKCERAAKMAYYMHLIKKAHYIREHISSYGEPTELEEELIQLGIKYGYDNLTENYAKIDVSAEAYEIVFYLSRQGYELSMDRIAVEIARIRGLSPKFMDKDEDTAKYYEKIFITK